jgi:DNA-binding LacI/PurR family transcriptional regulator
LLADWFDENYQLAILRTAEDAVAQRGSSLLAFGGGIPGSHTRASEHRALAFDLIDPRNVDGAILLAGTMVNELGTEAVEKLIERLDGLPLCAIGIEVPGVPSILVDNQAGTDQAMTHLVDRHKARRVAFIRGPNKNKEAESRFAAYRAALERANISYDDKLVYQGDFLKGTGRSAVAHWLAKGIAPDAIFAANDEMALGALHELNKSGKSVPNDVALVGFDDMEGAANATPPLTTVRQPLQDLAVGAVRTIMDQILGRDVPKLQVMQTHFVLRESCGCTLRLSSTGQSLHPDSSRTPIADTFAEAFARRRQSLKAELQRAARGQFQGLGAWEDKLIDAFAEHLTGEHAEFLEQLSQCVSTIASAGGDVARWHDVVSAFRRYSIPCCGADLELRATAEDLLQDARMATANAVERHDARKRMELERFSQQLVSVGSALAGSFDLAELSTTIETRLPKLGVTACYVAVYEPFTLEGHESLPEKAHLVAAFDSELEIEATAAPFDVRQIAPSPNWPPARLYRFVALPLFHKNVDLGFALIECHDSPGAVLEAVREQLSIALYGALLAQR